MAQPTINVRRICLDRSKLLPGESGITENVYNRTMQEAAILLGPHIVGKVHRRPGVWAAEVRDPAFGRCWLTIRTIG